MTEKQEKFRKQLTQKFNAILIKQGQQDEKETIVWNYTTRTTHSSECSIDELLYLIDFVSGKTNGSAPAKAGSPASSEEEEKQNMRKYIIYRIYKLPMRLGWYTKVADKPKFSSAKFDNWLLNESPFEKRFNDLTLKELGKLKGLINKWVTFYDKKAAEEKAKQVQQKQEQQTSAKQ